jgi:hypothetical protein
MPDQYLDWYQTQEEIRRLWNENVRTLDPDDPFSRREMPEERIERLGRTKAELMAAYAERWPTEPEQEIAP